MSTKIIAFAGSNRHGSINRIALGFAVDGARQIGAEVELIELRDYTLPLYDADWHTANGVPEAVKMLRAKMIAADGLLIASPEYNSSITPLLKNTIDWLSQSVSDGVGIGSGQLPFEGKIVGLMSASAGGFGGIRALPHVANILSNLGSIVLPIVAVPGGDKVMNADGSIANARAAANLQALGTNVAKMAEAVAGSKH
jgi:chromate reductase, NAD(P)H dehydrogenase (quinone)